ncbi:MAG: FAD-linked oxidase C-terminal domain-containing protein, partial [Pseudomonadota bacterium]
SLPTKHMGAFVDETRAALSAAWPNAPLLFFGHVGDNNLHIALGVPSIEDVKKADDIVYDLLRPYRGSISAEHGVGVLKREYLDISRNPIEIDLMRQLKQTLDPNGLLNRDRIFLF